MRSVRHCTRLSWHDHFVIEHGESVHTAYLQAELQALRSILLNNGYPRSCSGQTHNTITSLKCQRLFFGPRPCPVILQLPWIGHKSELFHQKANAAVHIAYFSVKVRTVFKTSKMFSLPKDVLPNLSNSNVIYLYECRHCESRYVGRTLQRPEDRVIQHVPRHLLSPTDGTEKKTWSSSERAEKCG